MKAKSYIPALTATTLIGVSALALSGNAIAAGTNSGLSSNSMSSDSSTMMSHNSMSGGNMMSHNGMSGSMSQSRVKSIQRALKRKGMDVNTDGIMGPNTKSALRQYQRQHNLKVTGRPDKATCKSLGVGMGSNSMNNSGMSSNSMSGSGMSGNGS